MTTAEGGLITTNNKELADFCRIGRNYGDDGSYNTAFNGLNARMSELHAIVGLESLKRLDNNLKKRIEISGYFKEKLLEVDNRIEFQKIPEHNKTTFKDFSIYINREKLGYSRDDLHDYLLTKNIIAKKYFYPPLHLQMAYSKYKNKYQESLPVTSDVSKNVLSLPMYSHIKKSEISVILEAIEYFYHDR
jgi:dTDP-4-amino-4,6-dideoxygalactose transaminase